MIFYFSGTGNSLYVAHKLLEEGERLVDMAAARRDEEYTYRIAKGERVGFVFPVYFYTVNDLVREFVNKMELEGAGYIYAVITCGGGIGGAGSQFNRLLADRGYKLCRLFKHLMPDNAVFYFKLPTLAEQDEKLARSDKQLEEIITAVKAKKCRDISNGHFDKVMRGVYHKMNSTKDFRVSEDCISCGKCAERCPDNAIEMQEGRPVWVKPKCLRCAACISRCPVQAIEYGKETVGRVRYLNPIFR